MQNNTIIYSDKYQSNIHAPSGRLVKEAFVNQGSSLLGKTANEQFMDELSPQNRADLYEQLRKMQELINRAQNDPSSRQALLHTVAMTAGEKHGPNLNGDYFSRDSLIKGYPSFVDNSHVYLEHRHNDMIYGRPLMAIYNDNMDRIELIAQIDCSQLPNIYEKMLNPDTPVYVSMSTNVPWDRCSICGNERNARLGVPACEHVQRGRLNTFLPGTQKRIFVENPPDVKFFDISLVENPADPMARSLAKVASDKFYIQVPNMYTVPAHMVQSPEIFSFKATTKRASDARRELTKTANMLFEQDAIEEVVSGGDALKIATELAKENISFKQYMLYKVSANLAFTTSEIDLYNKYNKRAGFEAVPEQANNVMKFFVSTPVATARIQNKLDTIVDHVAEHMEQKEREKQNKQASFAELQTFNLNDPLQEMGFIAKASAIPELQDLAVHYITKVAYGTMARDIRDELSKELAHNIQTENYEKAMKTIVYLVNQNRTDLIPKAYVDDPIVIELVQKAILNKQYGTETIK